MEVPGICYLRTEYVYLFWLSEPLAAPRVSCCGFFFVPRLAYTNVRLLKERLLASFRCLVRHSRSQLAEQYRQRGDDCLGIHAPLHRR